ncbi:LysM peptidoglycan-binding domain-containing protein [Luteimonas sp. BDR2-5]|uniref:LysM peptidoglycan-binding domain-containing protein n=1 Tax=Proluteimonas luteida TaxID=2878685 RepID=UPI001E36389F|nr:LysM peptidoglycan-binding domain-containing protein [Luteimonas sp. BDR2-5]MCD9027352.1 LysM peptidoglycan-binding domain-containing protein [Luteimonas sp. BDR2-5]
MFQRLSRSLRTASAVALLTVTTFAAAQGMRGDHPDTYVVVRGDTLWGIAGRFLDKPWLWPEIWQANPQIANPHLIYPGDVISLAYLNRVTLQPGPRPETIAPIDAISLADIEPFLKNRSIVFSFDELPYVLGAEDTRLRGSLDRNIYVTGLDNAQPGQRYAVIRPATEFYGARRSRDLDYRGKRVHGEGNLWRDTIPKLNGQDAFLGYEIVQMGVATVLRGPTPDSEATTLVLDDNGFEARPGDRLTPVNPQPYDLQFFPHPPSADAVAADARILAVADALITGGPRDVIAISAGHQQGVDNGTVFSVWRGGPHSVDRVRHPNTSRITDAPNPGSRRNRMPDEYAAHAMVFRTFDHVSYALVMEGEKPAQVGYRLKHPDATY